MNKFGADRQLSKSLSWLLRHGAVKEGLAISDEGYISVASILNHKSFNKYKLVDIERVVKNNEKQRFNIRLNPSTNLVEIKANQGHSIEIVSNAGLTPILEPKYTTIVHGTYLNNWESIKYEGLSRMKRKHIHFAKGILGDPSVKSGMRKDVQVLIYIDLEKALKDLKFYESVNSVILTEGDDNGFLKPYYFLKVVKVTSGKIGV